MTSRRSLPARSNRRILQVCVWLALAFALLPQSFAVTLPPGFSERLLVDGLNFPTAVRFSPDGRMFVAERTGRILEFSGPNDTTPTMVAEFTTPVAGMADRGVLGFAIDPGFPSRPFLYVFYTHDFDPNDPASTEPLWSDVCPNPPGSTTDGCVVNGRLSRFALGPTGLAGPEQVLIEHRWCQQFPTHSVGDLVFDDHGALLVSSGDGAHYALVDYGQEGGPSGSPTVVNPCADPPVPRGVAQTAPSSQGGALRSQDLRTSGDPLSYDGTVLRIDPDTGAAWPDNPLVGGNPDDDRVIAFGLRNPYRMAVRPNTEEVWIGDVGWDTWEEINRISSIHDAVVENFGWPCYEGDLRQPGYDSADLTLCENLYADQGAPATAPFFTYRHGAPVPTDGSSGVCAGPEGTSAVSGMAFYDATAFPESFRGGLFFADYSRRCVFHMRPDAAGTPDPATLSVFADGVEGPVDLQVGPDGFLYYVDFYGGALRRIDFATETLASLEAYPRHGPRPLTVVLDAAESVGGAGQSLSFAWDLDGDLEFDDAFQPHLAHMFSTVGTTRVAVRVTASDGSFDVASVDIVAGNTPPTVRILQPLPALH